MYDFRDVPAAGIIDVISFSQHFIGGDIVIAAKFSFRGIEGNAAGDILPLGKSSISVPGEKKC